MTRTSETVVTGDAVVLDVQVAQLPLRAVGALIDITVIFFGYFIGLVLVALAVSQLDTAFIAAITIVFTVVTLVGYPLLFETLTRGRSLGKMAMGLRVVSDDGGPERFRQALFRALVGVLEIWSFLGAPAVISSVISSKGKRLGDLFAGTVVICERGPRLAALPGMPPPLANWASTLQLSGLGVEEADRARQFLSRANELNPVIRDRMAYSIADAVATRISPAPPLGVPPQFFLAAVLAERHRRELMRLQPAAPTAAWGAPRDPQTAQVYPPQPPTAAPVYPYPTYPPTAIPPPEKPPEPPGFAPPS